MTSNRRFYIIRDDNETFRLHAVDAGQDGGLPQWHVLSTREMTAGLDNKALPSADRRFFLAMLVLTSGEVHQRRNQQRVTATGTRNILLRVRTVAEYIEETQDPQGARSNREKRKQNPGRVDMNYLRINQLVRSLLQPIKGELGLPAVNPVEYTYSMTERAIAAANDAECKAYLRRVKVGRLLTQHMYDKVKERLNREFPDDTAAVVTEIDQSASRDYLAAVSLCSEDNQLMVSVVNVHGDMITMEEWKFLKLVKEHGTFLSLGKLDRRGGWLPEPFLKFNANKVGEIVAIYTAKDSTLHVVCQNEVKTSQGKIRKETPDRAEFVIDQDYLLCIFITIGLLREDKSRFEELREKAEVKTSMTIDELFDREFFDAD